MTLRHKTSAQDACKATPNVEKVMLQESLTCASLLSAQPVTTAGAISSASSSATASSVPTSGACSAPSSVPSASARSAAKASALVMLAMVTMMSCIPHMLLYTPRHATMHTSDTLNQCGVDTQRRCKLLWSIKCLESLEYCLYSM